MKIFCIFALWKESTFSNMKRTFKRNNTVFRFRRYCRAAYAVFRSLKCEITIGRVATYIADRQLRKSVGVCTVVVLLMPATVAMAQKEDSEDAVTLPEVRVVVSTDTISGNYEPAAVLTAKDFSNISIRSVGDLLALFPGIDLRSRGINDVQGDISVHGGTFDQMVVLLNGINFTDAQTGHHNLDMPIDISMVERVEFLTPSMLLAKGIVSYCGGVNIVVSDAYCERLKTEVSGGSYGTGKLSFIGTKLFGGWATTLAASYNRSDGYMRNSDYRHGSIFLQATRHSYLSDWHLQMGGQIKNFGSQAFYSISYPDQYEATRTFTLSASNQRRFGQKSRLETDVYSRVHSDHFELFREGYADAPEWYNGHNRHITVTSGLRSSMVYKMGIGELLAGTEVRQEGVVSNVLGLDVDTPLSLFGNDYPKASSRTATNIFTGYRIALGRWHASMNVLGVYSTFFGWNYGFSTNADYKLSKNIHLSAALSRTYRMPSFTDLYYQSVNQVADPDLNSEKAWAGEVGLRYSNNKNIKASALLYYRAGTDIIDWVRKYDEEVWYCMNHTDVDAIGADVTASYSPNGFLNVLGCSYSYCGISQNAGGMISGSVLDYMRHKAQAFVVFAPFSALKIKVCVWYRYREGQYVDETGRLCNYGDVMLMNAKVEYVIRKVTIFAEVNNLTNRHYCDYGGVPQPGIMAFAGMRVVIGNNQ